ncbi:nitrate- and nitrite sensing domain-containing protein [Nonomuraea pusilla]|uniref:histidine kinase n=1 Tax=Nonomuraea pusilla TaxID=46177 RepID=A0A1H7W7Y6_9ACTN|nr:nitrate- and nitrite sensing domain-containing protein [Nonomuraea pusilla]SEM17047.1 Histidine kinase-, DNA gyrase B-, and HSP90-like ATPase [Nonomuraea pusilla]
MPRLALRNWRVKWRLTALILVPTVAAVVLAGARVTASVQSVAAYDRTATAAQQATHLRDLLQALGLERDTAGWSAVSKQLRKKLAQRLSQSKATVDRLTAVVRSDLEAMDDSYGVRVAHAAQQALYDLGRLSKVRAEGTQDTIRYDFVADTLLKLHDELTLMADDSQIVGNMRALSALAQAKEEISRQRIQLLRASYAPASVDAKEVERFIASNAREQGDIATVGAEAGPEIGQKLSKALMGRPEYVNSQLTKSRAVTLASGKTPGATLNDNLISQQATARDDWFQNNTVTIEVLHDIEKELADRVSLRSQELREYELRAAIIAGALILALLLVVLLLTVAIARSLVGPLRRLRTEALEIAGFRLPDVVRKLRVSGDTAGEVQPIGIEGNDEIGEVARAFDQVHRQAVRLAGEEAELRSNISSMFVNLSRRTQTLVERQISLIDGLEKGEQDGTRLADLFKLDHLATRMRRNSENLLVLAGHEATRRRSQPAKLIDVVRAALSEVEGYERVQVKVHRAISVVGSSANDLVHLVAELVENAIQFSPNNSQVVVSSSLIEGGGALLSVSDTGIGMTEEELAEANRRLAEPPVVDVSVSRRMGLFVVGRLALRHGIRVQLRRGDDNGLIAMVLLPPALIPDGAQQPLPQRPAFGGGHVPVPASPVSQNGTFRSFNSFDSFEGAARPTGYTNGSRPGPLSFDSGPGAAPRQDSPPHDAAPGPARPGAFASDPGAARPGAYPSDPGAARPGAYASDPGVNGFTADTDGGTYRRFRSGTDSGSFPSYPSGGGSFPPFPAAGEGGFPTPPPAQAPDGRGPSGPNVQVPPSYGTNDVRRPEPPAPSVEVSPLEHDQEEFLPIFASVESAWFRRPLEEQAAQGSEDEASPPQAVPSGEEAWRTAADAGWRAAAAASDPSLGGITAAGLPKRTPKANLVPGSASQPAQQQQRQAPAPPVSADRIRNRMASFQQGVRRGRQEVRGQEEQSE